MTRTRTNTAVAVAPALGPLPPIAVTISAAHAERRIAKGVSKRAGSTHRGKLRATRNKRVRLLGTVA